MTGTYIEYPYLGLHRYRALSMRHAMSQPNVMMSIAVTWNRFHGFTLGMILLDGKQVSAEPSFCLSCLFG
jgi:hypothetical protein